MRSTTTIIALLLVALTLTACGVRGDVEPPPGAKQRDRDKPVLLDPLIKPQP